MKHYQQARFLLGVAKLSQLPPDEGIEVAIVGRSNAGKSSVLNEITQSKSLARVSKTPGRTQQINLFALDDNRRLADLPGYGYAKAPKAAKEEWLRTADDYFQTRECLKGLIVVMDIRHPLQELDQAIITGSSLSCLPTHILLNKADKLTKNELRQTEATVKKQIAAYGNLVSYQIFSALKGTGVKELQTVLDRWFDFN